jgi:hypothetical protein
VRDAAAIAASTYDALWMQTLVLRRQGKESAADAIIEINFCNVCYVECLMRAGTMQAVGQKKPSIQWMRHMIVSM